jgi:hypothetical protein
VKVPFWLYMTSMTIMAGTSIFILAVIANGDTATADTPPPVPGNFQIIDMPDGYPDVAVRCYGEDQIFVTVTNAGTALWIQPSDPDCMPR